MSTQHNILNAQHFLLGKQSQLLAVLVAYGKEVPKSFAPATQTATFQAVSNGLCSEIHSFHFAEKGTHVEDRGGVKSLNQSG